MLGVAVFAENGHDTVGKGGDFGSLGVFRLDPPDEFGDDFEGEVCVFFVELGFDEVVGVAHRLGGELNRLGRWLSGGLNRLSYGLDGGLSDAPLFKHKWLH